ncbi:hypothetical protein HX882_07680 [Pseudomonas gingeri]|uniref:Uncharacterized protein n=1 Tax=Pseudomonas gingeri TaxID=117681 RepID=A0A7Y8C1B1_9PSED|nr:hypothetical protein [Pseudomonas gingeri]NWB95763.1 hypothetical protein [Pseudomonas gingeri]
MKQDVSIMSYGGAATVSFGDGGAHLVTIGKEFTAVGAQGAENWMQMLQVILCMN